MVSVALDFALRRRPVAGMIELHNDLRRVTSWIRNRRTIKPVDMDTFRPVDRELVEQLLENACWAPTHGMTEPWRFRIHAGPARQPLAATLQRLYRETTPEALFRSDKLAKLGSLPLLAPVVILLIMARDPSGRIAEVEEIAAVACAVQNLHLSASAIGLGGFWSTPPLLATGAASDAFSLAANERCLGLFYLGWPRPGFAWPQGSRSPLALKATWIQPPPSASV